MAENGVNGTGPAQGLHWNVGFMNSSKKYLTAETFGFKINASAPQLKKKQVWSLEQAPSDKWVYIRSHLGRYMTSDKYGTVTAEAEEKTENERFIVEYSPDGKWAFKHVKHGNYLSGQDAEVICFSKKPVDKEWWSIQFYIHPQITLRNVNRKRYAKLSAETGELECTEVTPWGADSLIILEFLSGKYAIKSCDNRYLTRDGSLQNDVNADALYTVELYAGSLAFKDSEGRYLTAVGKGAMKGRNKTISKDELFCIEDSHPQVRIVSHNDKNVSIKQGVDVSANQDELTDTETFQIEYDQPSGTWAILTSANKYWALNAATGKVQATAATLSKDGLFALEWQDDGTVGIKGRDGKYLSNKPTGSLFSSSSVLGDQEKFRMIIVNRPFLILKCEHGFVGQKGNSFICNKATYDVIKVEPTAKGTYILKGPQGKYLGFGDDNDIIVDDSPSEFQFQFCEQTLMAIKAPNGRYFKAEQTGLFKAVAEDMATGTMWEH